MSAESASLDTYRSGGYAEQFLRARDARSLAAPAALPDRDALTRSDASLADRDDGFPALAEALSASFWAEASAQETSRREDLVRRARREIYDRKERVRQRKTLPRPQSASPTRPPRRRGRSDGSQVADYAEDSGVLALSRSVEEPAGAERQRRRLGVEKSVSRSRKGHGRSILSTMDDGMELRPRRRARAPAGKPVRKVPFSEALRTAGIAQAWRGERLNLVSLYIDEIDADRIAETLLLEIRVLLLSHNNISQIGGIEKFVALRVLSLQHNLFTHLDQLDPILELRTLEVLNLKGNACTHVLNYRAYVVSSMANLARLDDRATSKTERSHAVACIRADGALIAQILRNYVCVNQLEVVQPLVQVHGELRRKMFGQLAVGRATYLPDPNDAIRPIDLLITYWRHDMSLKRSVDGWREEIRDLRESARRFFLKHRAAFLSQTASVEDFDVQAVGSLAEEVYSEILKIQNRRIAELLAAIEQEESSTREFLSEAAPRRTTKPSKDTAMSLEQKAVSKTPSRSASKRRSRTETKHKQELTEAMNVARSRKNPAYPEERLQESEERTRVGWTSGTSGGINATTVQNATDLDRRRRQVPSPSMQPRQGLSIEPEQQRSRGRPEVPMVGVDIPIAEPVSSLPKTSAHQARFIQASKPLKPATALEGKGKRLWSTKENSKPSPDDDSEVAKLLEEVELEAQANAEAQALEGQVARYAEPDAVEDFLKKSSSASTVRYQRRGRQKLSVVLNSDSNAGSIMNFENLEELKRSVSPERLSGRSLSRSLSRSPRPFLPVTPNPAPFRRSASSSPTRSLPLPLKKSWEDDKEWLRETQSSVYEAYGVPWDRPRDRADVERRSPAPTPSETPAHLQKFESIGREEFGKRQERRSRAEFAQNERLRSRQLASSPEPPVSASPYFEANIVQQYKQQLRDRRFSEYPAPPHRTTDSLREHRRAVLPEVSCPSLGVCIDGLLDLQPMPLRIPRPVDSIDPVRMSLRTNGEECGAEPLSQYTVQSSMRKLRQKVSTMRSTVQDVVMAQYAASKLVGDLTKWSQDAKGVFRRNWGRKGLAKASEEALLSTQDTLHAQRETVKQILVVNKKKYANAQLEEERMTMTREEHDAMCGQLDSLHGSLRQLAAEKQTLRKRSQEGNWERDRLGQLLQHKVPSATLLLAKNLNRAQVLFWRQSKRNGFMKRIFVELKIATQTSGNQRQQIANFVARERRALLATTLDCMKSHFRRNEIRRFVQRRRTALLLRRSFRALHLNKELCLADAVSGKTGTSAYVRARRRCRLRKGFQSLLALHAMAKARSKCVQFRTKVFERRVFREWHQYTRRCRMTPREAQLKQLVAFQFWAKKQWMLFVKSVQASKLEEAPRVNIVARRRKTMVLERFFSSWTKHVDNKKLVRAAIAMSRAVLRVSFLKIESAARRCSETENSLRRALAMLNKRKVRSCWHRWIHETARRFQETHNREAALRFYFSSIQRVCFFAWRRTLRQRKALSFLFDDPDESRPMPLSPMFRLLRRQLIWDALSKWRRQAQRRSRWELGREAFCRSVGAIVDARGGVKVFPSVPLLLCPGLCRSGALGLSRLCAVKARHKGIYDERLAVQMVLFTSWANLLREQRLQGRLHRYLERSVTFKRRGLRRLFRKWRERHLVCRFEALGVFDNESTLSDLNAKTLLTTAQAAFDAETQRLEHREASTMAEAKLLSAEIENLTKHQHDLREEALTQERRLSQLKSALQSAESALTKAESQTQTSRRDLTLCENAVSRLTSELDASVSAVADRELRLQSSVIETVSGVSEAKAKIRELEMRHKEKMESIAVLKREIRSNRERADLGVGQLISAAEAAKAKANEEAELFKFADLEKADLLRRKKELEDRLKERKDNWSGEHERALDEYENKIQRVATLRQEVDVLQCQERDANHHLKLGTKEYEQARQALRLWVQKNPSDAPKVQAALKRMDVGEPLFFGGEMLDDISDDERQSPLLHANGVRPPVASMSPNVSNPSDDALGIAFRGKLVDPMLNETSTKPRRPFKQSGSPTRGQGMQKANTNSGTDAEVLSESYETSRSREFDAKLEASMQGSTLGLGSLGLSSTSISSDSEAQATPAAKLLNDLEALESRIKKQLYSDTYSENAASDVKAHADSTVGKIMKSLMQGGDAREDH